MQITLDIPEKHCLFQSAEELARMLKLNTAVDLYRQGRLSAGAAAEFVGDLNRYEFLYECRLRGIEPQTYTSTEELKAEVEALDKAL